MIIIIAILVIGYLLIATSSLTKVNKAAIAVFTGTVGWVLYICYGTLFVMSQHPMEYTDFLQGAVPTSTAVKHYVAENIFIKYVGRGAEIVLFLLATMTIVEVLDNNGCFDFFKQLMKTRRSRKLLWTISILTFLVSANLDNLTVTTMMLVVMHEIVPSRRLRMLYGSAIVVAANCGGALTVIGDPTGLLLWNQGAVTATSFSMSMALPCLVTWLLPTWWIARQLPERIDSQWTSMPYRGDDTNLRVWQRLLMLLVGIGGLWFIPSFHSITKLSPFLGALCVLAVLWVVNELMNRKLMQADVMIQRRTPRVLQYGVIQLMLFVMGMVLAVGVVRESGIIPWLARQGEFYLQNVWILGAMCAAVSSVLDTFATSITFMALHEETAQNSIFWPVIAYSTCVGGNLLMLGSMSGLALMKMERIHLGWYFRHVGWVVAASWIVGMTLLLLV